MSTTLPPAGTVSPGLQAVLTAAVAELVQQLVRGELAAALPRGAIADSPWMTPPAASKVTRIAPKTIRCWVRDGRIRKRLRNRSPNPKQPKYLVNIDDVAAVAEKGPDGSPPPSGQLALTERAREILAERDAKRRK
ncbi:MAG: hypothetical protein WCC48_10865 [Anaeromyxobacteraceae bacterium]